MANTSYSSSNSKDNSMAGKTLKGIGNLIRLLPTGTVFVFQFLNPVLTDNGHCTRINKYLTSGLIGLCGLSCGLSCFTDSYIDSDGVTHYGIATINGLWPSCGSKADLSSYKLRFGDLVHCIFTMLVFAVVSLLDPNTVDCFYPSFESAQKILLMVLPPLIGAISGTLFMVFPNKRHWIGYPPSDDSSSSSE